MNNLKRPLKRNTFWGILLGLVFSLSTNIAQAGSPGIDQYPFQKDIRMPQIVSTHFTDLTLDDKVLSRTNQKLSNLTIFDERNNEVEFSVFTEDYGKIFPLRMHAISSTKEGYPKHLVDDNVLTPYLFDEKKDQKNPSWMLIDIGQPRPLSRIHIYPTADANITGIEIKAGLTTNKLRTALSKRPYSSVFYDLATPTVRYVKISLWGHKIRLEDVKIIGARFATLYFHAEKDRKYRLFYGGPTDLTRYKSVSPKALPTAASPPLSREEVNAEFPEDFDGDGFDNQTDNCPYLANPSQKDNDGDQMGDGCDNAPRNKNYNQADTDWDGVGDIVDNCKLVPNLDQEDLDGDGMGNACDFAHAKPSPTPAQKAKQNEKAGIISLLVLAGVGYVAWRKTQKMKPKKKG